MQTVSVSELEAHLSRYLRDVRRGGEVQVLDRGRPIARITGLGGGSDSSDEARERLVQAGVLRPGREDSSYLLEVPPLQVSGVSQALHDERDDRL